MRPWPPTLPEFLLLCRPTPDFEKTFAEAQEQVSKRQSGKDIWSSKVVYWTAVEFGFFDLRSATWDRAKGKWSRVFAENLSRENSLPDIPDYHEALPAPGQALTDTATARAKLADIKTMLERKRVQRQGMRVS